MKTLATAFAGCTGRRAAPVVLLAALLGHGAEVAAQLPPVESDVFPPRAVVPLQLDRGLADLPPATGAEPPPASVEFGVSLLRNRVQRAQGEARETVRAAADQAALLQGRERQVDDLRTLLAHQDQLIGALQARVREAESRLAAAQAAPVAPPPATAVPAPVDGTDEDAITTELLVLGGLLLVIALLLGWVLVLRARLAVARSQLEEERDPLAPLPEVDPPIEDAPPPPAPAPSPRPGVRATPVASAPSTQPADEPPARGRADPRLLQEIDTLIAFEDYERAGSLLRDLVAREPRNAEYRLRLVHVEAATGNAAASRAEEEMLTTIMMDGPLSATGHRVLRDGRALLPGHPLFDELPDDGEAGGERRRDMASRRARRDG